MTDIIQEIQTVATDGPPERFIDEERWPQLKADMLAGEVTQA